MKSLLITLTTLIAASTASPVKLQSRAIDGTVLGQLKLVSQYAAATYCIPNHDGANNKLTCATGNCPLVEAADTTTTVEFRDTMRADTTGYIAVDRTNRNVICAFRGTKSARAWFNNLRFWPVSAEDICAGCKIHEGFDAGVDEVRDRIVPGIKSALEENPGFNVIVTGHSLGGALATITAAELRKAGTAAALYTYGAPRVGNRAFSDFVESQGNNYRVTKANDVVPRLPLITFGYVHVNPEYHIFVKDNQDIDASEINYYQEPNIFQGNQGAFGASSDEHGWYFGEIGACGGGSTEIA